MSFSISPTQSTSALPTRKSRQASSTALSPTSSYFSRQDSFASPNGLSGPPSFSSPVGQGYPSRRPYDSISMSMRQVSSASVSISGTGTSTPDYKRRARRMVERGMIKESEIERDWGNIEPDEVFRRLPVGEVRKVEAKMRTEALGKQAELRSMVGTRYRDLLTSATQITALHNSSIRLSRQLRNIADISSNPDTVAVTAETSTDVSDTDDVLARLPAAAHMKLLLDATEVLYVYLAGKEYLKAAYLWLVARVTKEGLSRMTDEIGATYQPLLQKQWETLLPFRSQIVQQATESLRTGDAGDIKALSETILTIVLLDNLAVPDALSVLLEQRLTALRTILTYTSSSPTVSGRKRSNSKTARSDREQITSTLRNAVLNLLATLSSARAVFDKTALAASDIKTTESLIEKLIRLVQLDSSVPTITAPAPLRRTSSNTSHTHHRRASRLVSISLPAQRPEGGEEPPISTSSTIASLPSAQILLRHLPPSVLTYTPFLTPPTDAQVSEKVSRWTDKAIEVLREATPRWLADMMSVKGIWEVKGAVAELLREGETERRIADSLDVLCVQRIKGVWEADLGELIRLAEAQVAAGVKRLAEELCEADMNPEKHLFSEISFPSTTTTLNTPAVTVPSFIAALKKRSAHRTPILDGILSALEAAVAAIKADRQGLPGQVCGAYTDMVGTTLQDLVDKLRKQLDAAAKIEGERKMYGELLVGRVALFIATTSSMFSDLTELDAKSETIDDLLDIHTQSTHTWLSTSIAAALAHLQPLFSSSRPPEVDQTWQAPLPLGPSAEVMHSLYALTTATRALGIPAGVQRPAVKTLIERYGEEVLQLDGWEGLSGTACAQAAVDLGWVHMILGREVRGELVNAMLEKTPGHLKASLDESLNTIISDSLRRTQLLLQPILILVSPDVDLFTATSAEQAKSTAAASRSGAGKWLRFGPPANQLVFPRLPEYPETDDASESVKSTGENGDSDKAAAMTSEKAAEATRTVPDFRSPVAVAKPGKRFNLLSITS